MKIMTQMLMLMVNDQCKTFTWKLCRDKRMPKMWKHFEEGMRNERQRLPILHLKLKVLIEKRKKNIELEFMRQLLDCTILTLSEISSSLLSSIPTKKSSQSPYKDAI